MLVDTVDDGTEKVELFLVGRGIAGPDGPAAGVPREMSKFDLCGWILTVDGVEDSEDPINTALRCSRIVLQGIREKLQEVVGLRVESQCV
jgi:hypothetical protein